eukprot:5145660-Pyramimonas_sp.AAC.2
MGMASMRHLLVCSLLLSSLLFHQQGRAGAVEDDEREDMDDGEEDDDIFEDDDDFSGVEEFVLDKPGDIDRLVQQVRTRVDHYTTTSLATSPNTMSHM